jgi:hypothetical protein
MPHIAMKNADGLGGTARWRRGARCQLHVVRCDFSHHRVLVKLLAFSDQLFVVLTS